MAYATYQEYHAVFAGICEQCNQDLEIALEKFLDYLKELPKPVQKKIVVNVLSICRGKRI